MYSYCSIENERTNERMNLRIAYLSNINDMMVAKVSGGVDNNHDD